MTTSTSSLSDELHLRPGLPAEFRYLEPQFPRHDWPTLKLHPTARHWLEIHSWFRDAIADLVGLGQGWREGKIEGATYRAAAIPRLSDLLDNLHGHHHHESENYFPALAAAEPPMAKGFALLDRDHDAIEHLLQAMADAGNGLLRGASERGDLAPLITILTGEIDRAAFLIGRHLDDEEEIIVPVLTLRGDPLQG